MNSLRCETVGLVLHFRDGQRTARCLDSLRRDGIRKVLLVDNSQDAGASLSALSGRLQAWEASGLDIRVEQPATNLGFSAGANLGLRAIREWHGHACVLLLNSDAELRPGASAAMRAALPQEPPAVAAACMLDRRGEATPYAYYQRVSGLLTRHRLPGAHRYLSGCCLMIHPGLAVDDLFDEDFFFYGEDIELGWRMMNLGMNQIAVAGAFVDHEGSAGSRNGSLFYEYHMAMAHLRLPAKLYRSATARLAPTLVRCITLPARATTRALRFRSVAPWLGLVLALFDLVARHRRDLTPLAPD